MDHEDFINYFQSSKIKSKKEIQRLKEKNLELTTKVTHLSKEVVRSKEIEDKLR